MVIGITGGVGSGKSTINDILRDKYGYRILLTDDMAKEMEEPGQKVYRELVKAFGDKILEPSADGNEKAVRKIDKSAFAYLIYNDPAAYADLILNGDAGRYLKAVTTYRADEALK